MQRKLLTLLSATALLAAAFGIHTYASPTQSVDEIIPTAHAAAVDYFLKIEGVDGESKDSKHQNWIDVESWSWGASQPGLELALSGGGGGGAGKVSVHDISIAKMVDKASPILMTSCANGKHYPKAVLTVRKAGGDQQLEYYQITLEDIIITSYQVGGGGGALPMESISLNFAKMTVEYTPTDEAGRPLPPVTGFFDARKNTTR